MKQTLVRCLFLAAVLLLSSGHGAHASSGLTISSLTLGIDGKTLTATLTGGSGTGYGPASGVTGLTVRTTTNSGADYPIAATAVSGSTLTVTLGGIVSSDDNVVVDLSSSSNLTDSGSNTATGQTGVAVTNNSAHLATRYAYNNSAIVYYGRFSGAALPTYQTFVPNTSSEADVVINGTDATAMVLYNSAAWEVSVDGGSYAVINPSISAGTNVIIPLFSVLSAGDHTVSIKEWNAQNYIIAANFIQVFGGTGAIRAPGASDGQGYGPSVEIFSGANYVDPGSWLPGAEYDNPTDGNVGFTGEWSDATARVKGHGSSFYIWAYGTGEQLGWEIDGVEQAPFTLPGTAQWGWCKIASGLDQSTDHIYTVKTITYAQAAYIDAFMFSGSSAAFSSSTLPAQAGLGGYGDSITGGAGLDSTVAYLNTLAQENGLTPYNRGWGGSLVTGTGPSAGQERTTDITSISPELPKVIVLYGTNDLGVAGNGSMPTSAFGTAYQTMLTDLLQGTTNTKFYVVGILPRSGYSSSTIAAWNGTGNGVLGSVNAVKAALPASASRLTFVDSSLWNLAGTNGTDYSTNYLDGLHPSAAGDAIVANDLNPYVTATGYTATGPASGSIGQASASFTVSIAQDSSFNGNQSITISDGGNGGTFTRSGGSASTSSVTVSPAANVTNFSFTYTPASTGTKTLTFSNGQGWSDPSPLTYSAQAIVPSAPTTLFASVSSNQTVTLNWTAPTSDGGAAITDYSVQYKRSADSSWITFSHTASAATSQTLTGLNWETDYDFRVAAVNTAGIGSYDTITNVLTDAGGSGNGGGSGGGGGAATPTQPTKPIQPTNPANPITPSATQLINQNGTFYLIKNGQKLGITNPGILASYGYTFSQATSATSDQVAMSSSSNLPPNNGALVKTASDPTVYLISGNQRYGFSSANVFTSLGYKFSSVLTVTTPELNQLPVTTPLTDSTKTHLAGTNILWNGTVYYIGSDNQLHAYPDLATYNSWNIPDDFSAVVPANVADEVLLVGTVESPRR